MKLKVFQGDCFANGIDFLLLPFFSVLLYNILQFSPWLNKSLPVRGLKDLYELLALGVIYITCILILIFPKHQIET